MGLAKLIATLGKDRSDRWHQTRLFITEHRQNRPLELLERSEEGLESGLIWLGKPAAAQRQAAGELADEPNLRLSPLRRKAIKGNHQAALRLGDLSQVVSVLALMTGQ